MTQLPASDLRFLDQTKALVATTHAQAAVIEELRETNALLKQQYDDLSKRHRQALTEHDRELQAMRSKFERELHDAIEGRDLAERKASETGEILRDAAERIMQGVRAMAGNEVRTEPRLVRDEDQPGWRRDLDSSIAYGPR